MTYGRLRHRNGLERKLNQKVCPICGKGYRGKYENHIKPLSGRWADSYRTNPDDEPTEEVNVLEVNRCDWNLNTARVERILVRLKAEGWVRAGPVGAVVGKVYSANFNEGLVKQAVGSIPMGTPSMLIGPEHDQVIWWLRGEWAKIVAHCQFGPIKHRAVMLDVLRHDVERREVAEATFRIGGSLGLAPLLRAWAHEFGIDSTIKDLVG